MPGDAHFAERPTDDNIEVAIGIIEVCGLWLTQLSPEGINAVFEYLWNVLHGSEINQRAQNTIIVVFAIRKDRFKDHPVREGLDLVEEDDQATRVLPLEDYHDPEDVLNVFKMDPNFMENEEKYKAIKKETLDEGDSDSITDHKAGSSEDKDEGEGGGHKVSVHDKTEINLVLFHHQGVSLFRQV